MGFRSGSYARVWEVKDGGKYSDARITVSQKDKKTGEYETSFSGFVRLIGEAHQRGKKLDVGKNGVSVRLGDCDVTTKYDKKKEVTYYNFVVYNFMDDEDGSAKTSAPAKRASKPAKIENEDEDEDEDADLPF